MKILTIGVYGFTEDTFFKTLEATGVNVFCDIRWRRGVRGSAYAFANHKRLQARLETLGITYIHRRDLAPTPEIRQRQKDADKAEKIAKRNRSTLSPTFIQEYRESVLASFDPQSFFDDLPEGTRVAALFCVEREPAACHRSLVAEELRAKTRVEIEHLQPETRPE